MMQESRVFRVIAWYFEKSGHLTEPTTLTNGAQDFEEWNFVI